jgi:uncharacterized protein DUF3857
VLARRILSLFLLLCAPAYFAVRCARGQSSPQSSLQGAPAPGATVAQEKPAAPPTPQTPAQITLLETHYRFEADGSSRKEVHTVVKINSELGVRQFAHLNFDYNRAWQSIEIPMVRVTHSSGGTADVLPSAITDAPNQAVKDAPDYQDVRVKSVRILGLEPSDTLEYRVITSSGKSPLAPIFWLEHSFDRSGVVSRETLELDAPAREGVLVEISPETPANSTEKAGANEAARRIYRWDRENQHGTAPEQSAATAEPDLIVGTCTWADFASHLTRLLTPDAAAVAGVSEKSAEITRGSNTPAEKLQALYVYVSQKIVTVDLPLGATGFLIRKPAGSVASGRATAEDKFALLYALAADAKISVKAVLTGSAVDPRKRWIGGPGPFNRLLIEGFDDKPAAAWLDPSLEVAPFGMIPAEFRGKSALLLEDFDAQGERFPLADMAFNPWITISDSLPFPARQRVTVDAVLDGNGTLTAKVKYVMRGDNELLLRIAFHQSPHEKWTELAQLLSLSDGFRGKISSVSASDPLATKDPFTVEYEIAQPKFVDWSKKPVRIPALLPLFALPDPPAQPNAPIELGTPLEVDTQATIKLAPGFTAQSPTGTAVERDYAAFRSKYSGSGEANPATLTASRQINFIARQLPATRAADYRAFLRAVQNDEAQSFAITLPPVAAKPSPAKP